MWPCSTEWSKAKANRVLPSECTGSYVAKDDIKDTLGESLGKRRDSLCSCKKV